MNQLASNFFDMLDLLDNLENITLKDKEKHILDALMESDYNMLSRSDLSKLTKIPDSTLRRTLHKLEGLCLVECSRSSIKFIRLSPVLVDVFTFTGRVGYDFDVIRRDISHDHLRSSVCRDKIRVGQLHGRNSLNTNMVRSLPSGNATQSLK